ncbi:MAG: ABC transporter permease [Pseudomonadota bacterium]
MRNTFLVFRRDYLGYVSAWGFWLGLAALPILAMIGMVLGAFAASTTPARYYAVVESGNTYSIEIAKQFIEQRERILQSAQELSEAVSEGAPAPSTLPGSAETLAPKFIEVPAPGRTVDALRPWLLGDKLVSGPDGEKPLFAAIIVPEDGGPIQYWSENVTVSDLRRQVEDAAKEISRTAFLESQNIDPDILERANETVPDVAEQRIRTIEEQAATGNDVTLADQAPFVMSVGIAFMLWFMIFSVIQYLLMNTIEERSNKIFDTLLTSVRLPQLLAGKLAAVFGVTLTMMGTWGLLSLVFVLVGATNVPPEMLEPIGLGLETAGRPEILLTAIISLVLGYLMYGVIFVAIGSLCDTIQEAQTLISPLMMLLMLPLIAISFTMNDPNSVFVSALSWVPLFTPFLLILRIPTEPPMMEVFAQMGLMAATTIFVMWLATKVYRAGAVHGAGMGDAMDWIKRSLPWTTGKQETPASN